MSLRTYVKSATGSNVWLRYAFLAPWRLMYGSYSLLTGNNIAGSHAETEDDLEACAVRDFTNYKTWGSIERFHGRLAEVGPGVVSGTARLFIADGCSEVDTVDRFHCPVSDPPIRRFREPAERFFLSHRGYDFIVSVAVLEHVADPLAALKAMASALAPGGIMVHGVDCRDHEQFSGSLPELSFLRISRALYWPLTIASGLNRVRISAYEQLLEQLGFKCRALITRLIGSQDELNPPVPFAELPADKLAAARAELSKIRPRLAHPFRAMPEKDLLVSAFVFSAQR